MMTAGTLKEQAAIAVDVKEFETVIARSFDKQTETAGDMKKLETVAAVQHQGD